MDGNDVEFFVYIFRDDVKSGPVSDDIGIESSRIDAPAASDVPTVAGGVGISTSRLAIFCCHRLDQATPTRAS
jgi:hypothetical protein